MTHRFLTLTAGISLAVAVCLSLAYLTYPEKMGYVTSNNILGKKSACVTRYIKPIVPIRSRDEIPEVINRENFTVGAELGVRVGEFAEHVLNNWPTVERYYLVDLWAQQENYKDLANADNEQQEALYQETKQRLSAWTEKTVFLRNYTSLAVHSLKEGELDYVYVDARHDYCGCMEDMELYWPKVREGGIMAGHDYKFAEEVEGQDWYGLFALVYTLLRYQHQTCRPYHRA